MPRRTRTETIDAIGARDYRLGVRMRLVAVGLLGVIAASPAGALAEPASALGGAAHAEPRLTITVDAPCTDETDFWLRVRDRTRRVLRAWPRDSGDGDVHVVIRADGTRAEGTLRVRSGSGELAERRVDGRTCEEVAGALSLALALAFDPAALAPAAAPSAPAPSPPAIVVPAPRPDTPRAAPRAPAPEPPSWRVLAGAHATALAGDRLPAGGEAFVELLRPGARAPALRLSFDALYARAPLGDHSASFIWAYAVPEVCPARFGGARFGVSPCAGFAMGLLEGSPSGIARGRSYARAWLAPRIAARASVRAGPRVAIEAQLSLALPLVRGRFTFHDAVAYEVPVLVPAAAVGASYAF